MTSGEILNLIEARFPASRRAHQCAEGIIALAELLKAYFAALTFERMPLYNFSWPQQPGLTTWPTIPNSVPGPYPLFPVTTCGKPFAAGMTGVKPVTVSTTGSNAKTMCQTAPSALERGYIEFVKNPND